MRRFTDTTLRLLLAGPTAGPRSDFAVGARIVAGAVFVVFGAGKFINHASETASFKGYGLPAPSVFVYVIGAIELAGGILLIIGLATRFASLVLAGDMVGAIIASGINRGELISLTLAPAAFALCLYLLWTGPGHHALDRRSRIPAKASRQSPAATSETVSNRSA